MGTLVGNVFIEISRVAIQIYHSVNNCDLMYTAEHNNNLIDMAHIVYL